MADTGYHRLRKGRYSEPGRIYLLTTVTHGRRPLFRSLRLARAVIACLRYPHDRGQVASLAFVVMPDHLHWLVQMQQAPTLADLMGPLKTHSARAINQRRGAPGVPVWQEGFHDRAIRREEDIEALARYVVANPLRAGLVDRIGDYPHWDAAWLSGSEPVF
jgi:REP element-mobilizing transposase RayT